MAAKLHSPQKNIRRQAYTILSWLQRSAQVSEKKTEQESN